MQKHNRRSTYQNSLVESGDRSRMLTLTPMNDDDRLAEMVRRAMLDELPNQSMKDINMSPFTLNIRSDKSPPNFKLLTLETYDGKTNPIVHLMRYISHTEVLGAYDEVIR